MTEREFAYWLQGFFELVDPKELNAKQTKIIKNHLNLVFFHEVEAENNDKVEQSPFTSFENQHNNYFHNNVNDGDEGLARC